AFLRELLMASSPAGPGHDLGELRPRAGCRPEKPDEKAADLRDGDRDMRGTPGRARRAPFLVAIVSTAKASRARVRWRCQPCQLRTSYWSSPTSPLACLNVSSMVQRAPATRTTSSSRVPTGA